MVTQLVSPDTLRWIDDLRAKYGVPGMGITVIRKDGSSGAADHAWKTQTATFGKRNAAGDPFDDKASTIFGIASNSKMYAALSAWLLIDQKATVPRTGEPLRASSKLADIIPDWKLPDDTATRMTDLDDLASMRVGVAPHHLSKMPIARPRTLAEQLQILRHLTMSREFRQQFQYDSLSYVGLAHIVECLTGRPYHEFLESQIFDKLGYTSAYCDQNKARATGQLLDGFLRSGGRPDAQGMDKLGIPQPVGWWTEDDGLWCLPHGGIAMALPDTLQFLREMLEPTRLPVQAIRALDEELMVMPLGQQKVEPQGPPTIYGRGQMTSAYRGHTLKWHSGNLPGQVTLFIRVPSKNVGFFLVLNDGSIGGPLMTVFRNKLLDELLGLSPVMPYENMLAPLFADKPRASPFADRASRWGGVGEVYFHPGYGSLHLEPFEPDSPQGRAMIDIARQQGVPHNFGRHCYVARFHNLWLTHLVFQAIPREDDHPSWTRYKWCGFRVYDVVGRKGEACVATARTAGTAVFTADGIGMFDGFWSAFEDTKRPFDAAIADQPGGFERGAELWFHKIRKQIE